MGHQTFGIKFFYMAKIQSTRVRRPAHNFGVRVAEKMAALAVSRLMNSMPTPGDVAKGQSNPANDAITSQRDIARITAKRKRLNKKSKRRIKRKTAFRKKVTKALATKQSMHSYAARTTVVSVNSTATDWMVTPYQIVVSADGLSTASWPRFVMGEQNYNGDGGALTTGFSQYIRNFFSKLQTRWNATDVAPPNTQNFHAGVMVTHEELNLSLENTSLSPYNIDIYECVAARDITANDPYGNPSKAWTQLLDTETNAFDTGVINTTNILKDTYGVTPYEAPNFGKHWKILSKTRIYMSPQQATAMQFQNRPHFWREDRAQQLSARKGITKHIMFVIASEIGFDLPVSTTILKYAISKQIHFKFPSSVANLTQGLVCVAGQTI